MSFLEKFRMKEILGNGDQPKINLKKYYNEKRNLLIEIFSISWYEILSIGYFN